MRRRDRGRLAIGVDIGGTKVLGGVVDADGHVLAHARRDTPADDVARTLDSIVEVVRSWPGSHDGQRGRHRRGRLDRRDPLPGAVRAQPGLARRAAARPDGRARIGLPVVVENDGNAAAWAEFRYGAARDADRLDGAGHRRYRASAAAWSSAAS